MAYKVAVIVASSLLGGGATEDTRLLFAILMGGCFLLFLLVLVDKPFRGEEEDVHHKMSEGDKAELLAMGCVFLGYSIGVWCWQITTGCNFKTGICIVEELRHLDSNETQLTVWGGILCSLAPTIYMIYTVLSMRRKRRREAALEEQGEDPTSESSRARQAGEAVFSNPVHTDLDPTEEDPTGPTALNFDNEEGTDPTASEKEESLDPTAFEHEEWKGAAVFEDQESQDPTAEDPTADETQPGTVDLASIAAISSSIHTIAQLKVRAGKMHKFYNVGDHHKSRYPITAIPKTMRQQNQILVEDKKARLVVARSEAKVVVDAAHTAHKDAEKELAEFVSTGKSQKNKKNKKKLSALQERAREAQETLAAAELDYQKVEEDAEGLPWPVEIPEEEIDHSLEEVADAETNLVAIEEATIRTGKTLKSKEIGELKIGQKVPVLEEAARDGHERVMFHKNLKTGKEKWVSRVTEKGHILLKDPSDLTEEEEKLVRKGEKSIAKAKKAAKKKMTKKELKKLKKFEKGSTVVTAYSKNDKEGPIAGTVIGRKKRENKKGKFVPMLHVDFTEAGGYGEDKHDRPWLEPEDVQPVKELADSLNFKE